MLKYQELSYLKTSDLLLEAMENLAGDQFLDADGELNENSESYQLWLYGNVDESDLLDEINYLSLNRLISTDDVIKWGTDDIMAVYNGAEWK